MRRTGNYPGLIRILKLTDLPGATCVCVAGILLSAAARGQDPPQPRFEVASIKLAPGRTYVSPKPERTGGRIRWMAQLAFMVGYAYNVDLARLEGGSNLAPTYSLEATCDPAITEDQLRVMVRALLEDRFKLRAHTVSLEAEGHSLTVGKSGLKIREFKESDPAPPVPDWYHDRSPESAAVTGMGATLPERGVTALAGRRVSMTELAQMLERLTKAPVWDRTGLSGKYYFAFRFAKIPGWAWNPSSRIRSSRRR